MSPVGRRSFPEKLPPDYAWQQNAVPDAEPDTSAPMRRLRQMDDEAVDDSVPTFSSRVLLFAGLASLAWLALA
ncbi:hypothetical protein, partial [Sphingosinicella sp.]|uniref:hypothetical protein n=1 Tax=Sphingosinicella sp. TaxID=1917971 RepID=UPI0026367445